MTFEELESTLRIEFIGEMKGFGQALELLESCVFHHEGDQKNYVDGNKFRALIRERKKLLQNRFERGRNF